MDTDDYLLCCCRYVERNPVKAGMVKQAEDYAWSSARARLGLGRCTWLDERLLFLDWVVMRRHELRRIVGFCLIRQFLLKIR